MIERIFEYGQTFLVEVISASPMIIAVHAYEVNEGFILTYHGLTDLPTPGDKGKIVFERDKGRGHWQYYKTNLQEQLVTKLLKASAAINEANRKSPVKPLFSGAMLIFFCNDEEFKRIMKMNIDILASPAQVDMIRERKKKLGIINT